MPSPKQIYSALAVLVSLALYAGIAIVLLMGGR
jgi:hypothetical protein